MDDHREVYIALADSQARGVPVVLATVIETQGSMPRHAGSKMVVYSDGHTIGTVGGGAMESLVIKEAHTTFTDGQPRTRTYSLNNLEDGDPGICGGTARIFIEPVGMVPQLLVIGGGHVGKALAELGTWAGYTVILSDDRAEFCNPEYAPGLHQYAVCKPSEVASKVNINGQTFIAAVTRGLPVDVHLIPELLQTPAPYIGLIGSRRRWALTIKALEEEHGLTKAELSRVRAPIGLEIEAETPKEIALSILAEIVMVRRGGTGKPMHWLGDVAEVHN